MKGLCPCGGAAYATCCDPALSGARFAPTAEALMRSRYTAFTRGDVAYLEATEERRSEPEHWAETQRWALSVCWLSLTIVSKTAGGESDATGEVEFEARYLERGVLQLLRERSTFSRRETGWVYTGGSPHLSSLQVERNAPCPCGSGRKFKQCHA